MAAISINYKALRRPVTRFIDEFIAKKAKPLKNKRNITPVIDMLDKFIDDIYVDRDLKHANAKLFKAPPHGTGDPLQCGQGNLKFISAETLMTYDLYKVDESTCVIAVKIDYLYNVEKSPSNVVERMFKTVRELSKVGVCPRVKATYVCRARDGFYAIIMFHVKQAMSLKKYIETYRAQLSDADVARLTAMIQKKADQLQRKKYKLHMWTIPYNCLVDHDQGKFKQVYFVGIRGVDDMQDVFTPYTEKQHKIANTYILNEMQRLYKPEKDQRYYTEDNIHFYVVSRLVDEGHIRITGGTD